MRPPPPRSRRPRTGLREGPRGAWALAGALAVALTGCPPKPTSGDPCQAGDPAFCESGQLAIYCLDGGYQPFVCPAGCEGNGVCNFEANGEGDPCPFPQALAPSRRCRSLDTHETLDCAAGPCEGAAALFCDQGTLREIPCRGPDGCFSDPGGQGVVLDCDVRLASEGDACHTSGEGGGTCGADDPRQVLVCEGGVFKVFGTCQTACVIEDQTVKCE